MSGRARLAVCATLATIAASCALLPLVDPAVWLLQAALLVAVQAAVGAGARRVPLPRPVTVLVQAVVSLLLLTVLFARGAATAGVLPGPEVFGEFGRLLADGTQDVGHYAAPAPVTDGIRLMLVGGVLAVGLAVDALAVTYRSAAPAGLPLLALYSVAAGLAHGGARWLWFLCAAAGYLLLLLAESRERLARWGRIFRGQDAGGDGGGARFAGRRTRLGSGTAAPVRTGRRIGALTLGIALAVPAVLPSLGGGLLDPAHREHGPRNSGGTVSAVNPLVSLQDSLNQPSDRTALTYSTDAPNTSETYLRIVALDRFDGSSWKPSQRRIENVPDSLPRPPGLSPDVRTRKVHSSVRAAKWYAQNWLPMPYPADRIRIGGHWRFEPEGRTVVGDRGQTTRGARYRVDSLLPEPTSRQLRQAPAAPRGLREEYTKVPDSLPPVVHRTALRVTRGAKNPYERAVRLQDWFTSKGGFTYDTHVRAGSGSAAIVNFLEQKEGFCVHFAFSMAAMARTLGIPARVAVGFTPGTEQSNGRMEVGLKDAHAWPELYFEGAGWTRFEPTPTRGTAPSYAQQRTPDGGRETSPPPQQHRDRSTKPASTPSAPRSEKCSAHDKTTDPRCGAAAPGSKGGGGHAASGFPAAAASTAAAAVAALLVLGALLLPLLWRTRVRAGRLGERGSRRASAGPGGGRDPGAAVQAAWRELLDTAWDYGVLPDEAETPRTSAERVARVGELGPEPAGAAHRVASAVEQVRYAPRPHPDVDAGVVADVRQVRAALRTAAPRRVRMRALLLPPSSRQVLWAVTDRWRRWRDRRRSALRARFAK